MKPGTLEGLAAKATVYDLLVEHGEACRTTLGHALAKDAIRIAAHRAAPPAPASAPDHRALDAYREWLHLEGKLLGIELYGNEHHTVVPTNTAARDFHFPSGVPWQQVEQPSARAERMCALLGIDWRRHEPHAVADSAESLADRNAA